MHEFHVITKKFTIRPFRSSDAADIYKNIQDRELFKNTLHIPQPYRLRDAQEHVKKNLKQYRMKQPANIGYVIDIRDRAVGAIGATFRGPEVEIGYWLAKRYRGRGMMSEAVALFGDWLQTTYAIKRLTGRVLVQNIASGRVLTKAGFRLRRKIKGGEVKDGQVIDILEYEKK